MINKIQFNKINITNIPFENFLNYKTDKYEVVYNLETLLNTVFLKDKVINSVINKMNVSSMNDLIFIENTNNKIENNSSVFDLFVPFAESKIYLLCFKKDTYEEDFKYVCRILINGSFI